jgi:hypothetical protein
MNTQTATELELISERAARIPELAAGHLDAMALLGYEEAELHDAARNIAGALEVIIESLLVHEGRSFPEKFCDSTEDHGPHESANSDGEPVGWCPGYGTPLPPWASEG